MVSENQKNGALADFVHDAGKGESNRGLTGPEIAAAYKAALVDFVQRKTSRAAIAEVSKLLAGALAARKQELVEQEQSSSHRLRNFY